MPTLTISVAMCTFNGERFLSAQLESIATQLRVPDELVICDDGSTDGSQEVIRQFAQRSPFPVRFKVNERNLGSTKNFEQAISLCQGTIVALADQDDVWYPHKLARMEKAFLAPGAIVAAFSDADLIDDDSRPLGSRLWSTFSFDRERQEQTANGQALKVLIRHPVVTGATMAFRREFCNLLIPIPPIEIHDRWISFLLSALGRFEVISEPLMQYRRHQGQQVGPGFVSLRDQIAQSRSRGPDHYLAEIDRFGLFQDRLRDCKADFPIADCAQNEIKAKISHLKHRADLPQTRIARVPKILLEAIKGHYWRFSGGWRSIANDLVIR